MAHTVYQHTHNHCTCIHSLRRGAMDNTVAAMMAIPTAVGWTAPLPALLELGPKVLPGLNSNEGTAQQQLVAQQQYCYSRLVLLFSCCIHVPTLACALLPNPHRITLARQPPKQRLYTKARSERGFPAFLYVAASCCRRRS